MRASAIAIAAGLAAVAAGVAIHLLAAAPAIPGAAGVPAVDRGAVPIVHGSPPTAPVAVGAAVEQHVRHRVPAHSRLQLRRLHVDAPIVSVRVLGGVMQIPRDPRTVGWWRGGAGPGDDAGTVVVVGHINYAGTSGALAALPDARPGDAVTVVEPGNDRAYRVAAVRTYPKTTGIPASVFDRGGTARLVLITCGGPFDADSGNYEDNIVVFATPA